MLRTCSTTARFWPNPQHFQQQPTRSTNKKPYAQSVLCAPCVWLFVVFGFLVLGLLLVGFCDWSTSHSCPVKLKFGAAAMVPVERSIHRASQPRTDWRRRRAATKDITSPGRAVAAAPPALLRCQLSPERRWLVVRRFVSDAEREALLNKALQHKHRRELHPNPCGPGRFFAKADDDPAIYVDPLLEMLTRRCERCLRLAGVQTDCVLGRTISMILPGGFIHRHTDAYQPGQPGHRHGFEHLRCNIVVKLADLSGRPVVEGKALPVDECDLWAFFASKCMHETVPLQGTEPRIVFGFGWSVPPSHQLQPAPPGWDES